MALFKGSGVALVTPLNEKGVNFDVLDKLIDHILDGGTNALFVCGTTGEPSTMTVAERESMIDFAVKKVDRRIPVFAGSGGNNTAEAVKFSQKCEQLGVDGLLVVTPYYNKCTQNGCVAHYRAIAESVNIPIVAYNVPTRTGFNIAPATAVKLSEIKNIVALKEASGDIDQLLDVARLIRGKMDLYSGDDSLTVPAMSIGAKGVISVAANVIPHKIAQMTSCCLKGDFAAAADIQFEIAPFVKTLFSEVNPIPCKKAMQLIGIDVGAPRLPLTEMEPEHTQIMRQEMLKLGLKV